jgi:hypothetical protein
MTIRDWSKTASSNQTGAPGIDWSEGTMLPPTINDSARAMMADIAKWRDDFQGSLTTGGSVNAYTLTTNAVYTSLTDGIMLKVRVNITNTAAATLNIDSLGAKALRKPGASADVALVAGDLVAGTDYIIAYGTAYNSAAGGWLVTDPSTLDGSILAALSVGTAALAANAVTNAKLATMATVTVKANVTGGTAVPTDVVIANLMDTVGSTRGTLYYRGASALLPLVPSTVGFVLRDGGSGVDPSWVGGMTKLNSGTASGAATLDITLPTGYRKYILELGPGFRPDTDATQLALRVSYDNGSTFQVTNYSWAIVWTSTGAAAGVGAVSSSDSTTFAATGIQLSTFTHDNASTGQANFIIEIQQGSLSLNSGIFWKGFHLNGAASVTGFESGAASHGTNDLYDVVRILSNSGNISGQWALYGVT